MKTSVSIALIVIAVVVATGAVTFAQFAFPLSELLETPNLEAAGELPPDLGDSTPKQLPAAEPTGDQPKAVVDKIEFDFGYLPNGKQDNRHSFIIRNEGTAPLKLLRSEVSCSKCTFATIPTEPIPPGGSAAVDVRWNINRYEEVFRQHVSVHTNDREHPMFRFIITGKIVHPFAFEPRELVFSNVREGEQAQASARLLAYFTDDLEVLEHRLSNPAMESYFDVVLTKLSAEELPDRVKSGVEFKVTLKPGLPLGAFKLKILLKTNLDQGEEEELELPIEGSIGGPVSVVGKGWNQDRGILGIGHVNRNEGVKRNVTLIVRGSEFSGLELEPAQVDPAGLKVTYGKQKQINGGQTTIVPVTIELPPGSSLVNRMGSEQGKFGEIIIPFKTDGLPRVKILVQFAVVEN